MPCFHFIRSTPWSPPPTFIPLFAAPSLLPSVLQVGASPPSPPLASLEKLPPPLPCSSQAHLRSAAAAAAAHAPTPTLALPAPAADSGDAHNDDPHLRPAAGAASAVPNPWGCALPPPSVGSAPPPPGPRPQPLPSVQYPQHVSKVGLPLVRDMSAPPLLQQGPAATAVIPQTEGVVVVAAESAIAEETSPEDRVGAERVCVAASLTFLVVVLA